jgi:hypothetical protein
LQEIWETIVGLREAGTDQVPIVSARHRESALANRPMQLNNLKGVWTESAKLFSGEKSHRMNNANLHKSSGAAEIIESSGNVVIAFLKQLEKAQILLVCRFSRLLNQRLCVAQDAVAQTFERNVKKFPEDFPITFWNITRHRQIRLFYIDAAGSKRIKSKTAENIK